MTDGVAEGVAVGVAVGVGLGVGVGVGVGVGPAATLNDTSHSESAMRNAKVRKGAGLRKGMRINEACIVKSSLVAVHIIRGAISSVGCARIAASDTVVITSPRPPYGVAHRNVDCVGHKHEAALPHRYVEDLTSTRWHTAYCWSAVLIDNANGGGRGLFLLRF